MELTKKTTILFSVELYEHLARLARHRRTSLGKLVRSACEAQYGYTSPEDRHKAVDALRGLTLPVGTPAEMKRQSLPDPKALLP